jgi:putative nucleotidyltransferase with HDIG domain
MSNVLFRKYPSDDLRVIADSGYMKCIFPEIQELIDFKQQQGKLHYKNVWEHTLQVVDSCPQRLDLRFAALFHDVAKPRTYSEVDGEVHFFGHEKVGAAMWDVVADRLCVSQTLKEDVHLLIEEHLTPTLYVSDGVDTVRDSVLRKLACRLGDQFENLFDLSIADITSHNAETVRGKKKDCLALKKRIEDLLEADKVVKIKLPSGLGNVLMEALGLEPGRELGKLLKSLEEKLLNGEFKADVDYVEEAKKILGSSI